MHTDGCMQSWPVRLCNLRQFKIIHKWIRVLKHLFLVYRHSQFHIIPPVGSQPTDNFARYSTAVVYTPNRRLFFSFPWLENIPLNLACLQSMSFYHQRTSTFPLKTELNFLSLLWLIIPTKLFNFTNEHDVFDILKTVSLFLIDDGYT